MTDKHSSFVNLIKNSVLENLPPEYLDRVSVTDTKLNNIGVLGAGSLVMQKYLTGVDNRARQSRSANLFS